MPKAVDGVHAVIDTVYYPVRGVTPLEWSQSAIVEAARVGVMLPHVAITGYAPRWTFTPADDRVRV